MSCPFHAVFFICIGRRFGRASARYRHRSWVAHPEYKENRLPDKFPFVSY